MQASFCRRMIAIVSVAALLVFVVTGVMADYYCRQHTFEVFAQGCRSSAVSLEIIRRSLSNFRQLYVSKQNSELILLGNYYSMADGLLSSSDLQRFCNSIGADFAAITNCQDRVLQASDPIYRGHVVNELPLGFDKRQFDASLLNTYNSQCINTQMVSRDGNILLLATLEFRPQMGRNKQALRCKIGYKISDIAQAYKLIEFDMLNQTLFLGQTGGIDVVDSNIIVCSKSSAMLNRNAAVVYGGRLPLPGQLTSVERNGEACQAMRADTFGSTMIAYMPNEEVFALRNVTLLSLGAAYVFLFVVIYYIVAFLVKTTIIDGISRINLSLSLIANGRLDEQVKEESYPEFSRLSQYINNTVQALRSFMQRDSLRVAEQLELARSIQLSCLPANFPIYPEEYAIDLRAVSEPAQEVGGDFYDFFRIAPRRYGIVIADVTNHGIPAALFMMTAKTLLHENIMESRSLAQTVEAVNLALCSNNSADMFVTAFVGIIDSEASELTYVNCGHNPPLIQHPGGTWEKLQVSSGFVLGALESITFRESRLKLQAGDRLLLYTDGVTDLANFQGHMLGLNNLLNNLNEKSADFPTAGALQQHLVNYLDSFRDEVPPADDITLMTLDYLGEQGRCLVKEFPSHEEQLAKVQEFVCACIERGCASKGCPKHLINELMIVIEEIFLNIVQHGEVPDDSGIFVRAKYEPTPRRIVLHFVDAGRPFDPLARSLPNVEAEAEERPIGGLGILLSLRFSDSLRYRHEYGRNILRVVKLLDK